MKRKLQTAVTLLMAMMLLVSFNSWGQGFENFTNSNLTGTYLDGSFVGNGGITWTYVHSRDEGDFPIEGNGIMLRRADEPSSLSATIPGGVGEFSVDTRKAFTGNAQRQLELVINGVVFAQHLPAFGDGADDTVIPFEVDDINMGGSVELELRLYGSVGNQQIVLDNIEWTGYGAVPPIITNIIQTPDADITSDVSVMVSADVTEGDATVTTVELNWGTESGVYGNTIDMSIDNGTTYITDNPIPAQAHGTTVYYVVYAEDADEESFTTTERSYTVIDPAITGLPFEENFDDDLGDLYTYSVSGDTKYWIHDTHEGNGFAYMNGWNSGDLEDDWLILPGIDMASYTDVVMTFETAYNFGVMDDDNYLKLFYSEDYAGIGDPTLATWTELDFDMPASGGYDWEPSGDVMIPDSDEIVFIGFQYYYTPDSYRTWQVDDILIVGEEADDPSDDLAIPWSEDFSDMELPAGWMVEDLSSSGHEWEFSSGYANADSDAAGSGNDIWTRLTTAVVNCTDADNVHLFLNHWYHHLGSSYAKVEVSNDSENWIGVVTLTATYGNNTFPYIEYDISEVADGHSEVWVRFEYSDAGSWAWYWRINEVGMYSPDPTPMPAQLVGPADGAENQPLGLTLEWGPGGGMAPTGYRVYMDQTDPPATEVYDGAETTFDVSDLAYSTTYYWQVVPYNDEGDAIDPPVWSFSTMDDPTITEVPYTEDFADVTIPALPLGWSSHIVAASIAVVETSTWGPPNSPPHHIRFRNLGDADAEMTLITPPVGLDVTDLRTRFYARTSTGDQDVLQVGTYNPGADEPFTMVGSITLTTTYSEYTVLFDEYDGDNVHLAFRALPSAAWRTISFDDFVLEEIPATPIFEVTPLAKDFGLLPIGDVSDAQVFTLRNIGAGVITIGTDDIQLTGDDVGEFILDNLAETVNLGPNESATVEVSFAPTSEGVKSAFLEIDDNLGGDPHELPLDGEAYDAVYQLPFAEDFTTIPFPPMDWARWSGILEDDPTLTPITFSWTHHVFGNQTPDDNNAAHINIYGTLNHWLVSPQIDLGNGKDEVLSAQFEIALTPWTGTAQSSLGPDDYVAFLISTDGGQTWSPDDVLIDWTSDDVITPTGDIYTISLADYSGVVQFAFYVERPSGYSPDLRFYVNNLDIGEFAAPDLWEVTFHVEDSETGAALEGAMITVGSHSPLFTDSDGMALIDLADGTYTADVTLGGYISESLDFTVDGEDKTVHVALTAEEEPEGELLFVQQWFDGGTAATTAYDAAAEVDYEAADNFMAVDGEIDHVVIYGLTLKFNGSWSEQVPDPTEPFIVRFYDYEEEFVAGLEAPIDGTYEVALIDDFGDGWNGGLLSVFVNGVIVLDEITMDSGAGPDYHTFTAEADDEITTVYVAGSWSYENYYAILDPSENIIAEEGGTWDDPGDTTPGSIEPGGMFAMEPDWENPVSVQNLDAAVTVVGPVWNDAYTLYRFAMDLDASVDMAEGWMSAQIDAENGSGTWFLWINAEEEEGDGLAYQRIGEFPDLADRASSSPLSLRHDGQVMLTRSALDYDFGFELWGGEAADPGDAIDDFPWTEDFEADWVANPDYEESPEGWYVVNGADGSYWESTSIQSNTGQKSAHSYQGFASSNLADEWMITPAFNLDNPDATQMLFHGYTNQAPDGTRENMRIMILDQPYDNVADLHANAIELAVVPFTQTWEEYIVSLDGHSGVKHIAFNYYITADMNASFNWIYVDDIIVGDFETYTLTMLAPDGSGTVVPAEGSYDYSENTVVALEATANYTWSFDYWEVDGDFYSDEASTTITMDADKDVQAFFLAEDSWTLTMLAPEGDGNVTPAEGDHDYIDGDVVDLIASADMGYIFSHWTGDVDDPNSNVTTILMDDDKTVQAHFVVFDGIDLPWTETFAGVPVGEIPANWVRTHPNWSVQNTANAGGEAPEMRFTWTPASTDQFRVTSPKINTTGHDALVLGFDHYIDNFSTPGVYTLRVIAIADDVEYVVQEWVDPDNIGPDHVEFILTAGQHGVGTDDFYIAWELDGDSYDINQWYFDNIFLGEAPDMYEVTFFVGEDNVDETPIEGASINIDGDIYHTDENGLAVFMLVDDQTYTANVTASGYVAQEVDFTVDGADVSVDVLMMDNIVDPFNLSVITEDMDPGEALFIWNDYGDEYEFRYDDGVVDAQLGFTGTWNSVMGAVHFNDAILHEISWYLTAEGGPHNTVKVWVLGLTPEGLPDRNNVVYSAENVPNNDNEWTLYEFDTPIEMSEGFFIGLSYDGFLGLAVDDGVGEPWDFVPGTQFGVFNITDPTSAFTDISVWGFETNFLLRAYGSNLGDLSRGSYSGTYAEGPAPELIPLETRVEAGDPHFPQAGQRSFLGFNVYLNDALVVEEIMDTEYLFTNLPAGDHTAGVQSVYTTGSSDIVTIDFEITDEAETHVVTFEVDITEAMMAGQLMGFDPDMDHIFMTGSMLGWTEPGAAETVMTMISSDPWIYEMTLELEAGTYHYKYFSDFLGEGWDGGEYDGGDDREVVVDGDMTVEDDFTVGDAPEYTVTFEVFDLEGVVIDNAVITLGGVENAAGDYVFEGVPPGTYAYDVVADGYYTASDEVTVANADVTVVVELEPEVGTVDIDATLSIYPNPAREVLYIESGSDITGVRVVDILGQVVYSSAAESQIHEINVSGFDPGVYIIQVTTTHGVITQRVQVSR